jgi:hypothetical protein
MAGPDAVTRPAEVEGVAMYPVSLTINGVERRLQVAAWTTLLDLLRGYWT